MKNENLERIKVLTTRIREDEAWVGALREELRKTILTAWENGCTMQQIGDAAGLSRQRVSQIVDDKKR